MEKINVTFRRLRRLGQFVFYVALYLFESSLIRLFVKSPLERRRLHAATVSKYCKIGCQVLGIRTTGIDVPTAGQNYLLVGNHLGFLDILVLSSLHPALFVTSVEMRETPFLGTLCEMGGCLFVERRSRANIQNEVGEIREALQQGFCVALYPEGTSGDGSKVLPFKKTMLTSAAGTNVPIKIMVINYRRINGRNLDHGLRDYVCWYGDMSFPPALWRLFGLQSIDVDLSFHDEIRVSSVEDRHEVTRLAHEAISRHFTPIPFPESFPPATGDTGQPEATVGLTK